MDVPKIDQAFLNLCLPTETIAGSSYHVIQNRLKIIVKNRSIDKVQSLGKERRSICKALRQDSGQQFYLSKICGEIIADVYGEAMLETKASVTEFCSKNVSLSLEELRNIKIKLFLIQKLFR